MGDFRNKDLGKQGKLYFCRGSCRNMIGEQRDMVINWEELSKAYLFRFFSVSSFISSGYREDPSRMRALWPALEEDQTVLLWPVSGENSGRRAEGPFCFCYFLKCQSVKLWGSMSWTLSRPSLMIILKTAKYPCQMLAFKNYHRNNLLIRQSWLHSYYNKTERVCTTLTVLEPTGGEVGMFMRYVSQV